MKAIHIAQFPNRFPVSTLLQLNKKIIPKSTAPGIRYEFKCDYTFSLMDKDAAKNVKGKWKFDTNKKLITLVINGISNSSINSLDENELVMLVSMKDATPDDPSDIKMYFKRID